MSLSFVTQFTHCLLYCFALLLYTTTNIASAHSGLNNYSKSTINISSSSKTEIAALQNIARSQQASTPTIVIDSGGIVEFNAQVGEDDIQYYYVTLTNFPVGQSAFIKVDDPSGSFTISTDNATFSTTIEIKPNNDGYKEELIWVRYKPTEAAEHSVPVFHESEITDTQVLNLKSLILAPLPLHLINFSASMFQSSVVLEWEAAPDLELSHFEIFTSKDITAGFNKIGTINCNARNTLEAFSYRFVYFLGNSEGWHYFRVAQVFTNQNISYSPILPVKASPINKTKIEVFPNPFHASSQLRVTAAEAGKLKVALNNVKGEEVFRGAYDIEGGETKIALQPDHEIPAGMYILTTELHGTAKRLRLVIL